MKNKNILSISLGVVAVLILGIVIAYAALSTTLNAKFNGVTAGDIRWDVGFNTSEATLAGTPSSGAMCGDAHITSTAVTIDQVNLPSLNASCSYALKINNNGNLDAKVSNITPIRPDGATCTISELYGRKIMKCDNIEYSLDHLSENQVLTAGNNTYITLQVSYSNSSLTTPFTQEGGGFTFNFAQA